MAGRNDLEKLIIGNKPIRCEVCGEKMYYVGGGRYECKECGHSVLDDYGKVKEFLEEHGNSPAVVVSKATGVKMEIIEMFLKRGKVEIPEGSRYYLECESCGCPIRYGRFCPTCAKQLTGSILAIFNEEVGEKPKIENLSMVGKMHYFNRKVR